MSSPFVPSPFTYGDLPQGGVLTPMVVSPRAPSNTIDIQYTAGYLWLDSLDLYQIVAGVPVYGNGNLYYQAGNSLGHPNWVLISDLAGPVEAVHGTTNQITVVTSAGTATISIPSVFIAPGSIASTTTIAAGTALSAATTVTAGTGITATTGNITASTGNLVSTLGSVSAATTVTGGTGVVATTGNVTASAGDLVATLGNLDLNGVASKIVINATIAASASVGTTAAMTTGAVTITSSAITTSSVILYSRKTLGTAMGNVSITAQSAGSATLTSDAGTETSTFNYLIIN